MAGLSPEKADIKIKALPSRSWFDRIPGYVTNPDSSISYMTAKKINSTLFFAPSSSKDEPCSHIIQDYKDTKSNFNIHTQLMDGYLNTELRMKKSPLVNFVSVISQSFLTTVRNPEDSDVFPCDSRRVEGYKWRNEQSVAINLNEEGLKILKEEGVIPDRFTNKIWIKADETSGQLTVKSEKTTDEPSSESSVIFVENLLEALRKEFGLVFSIKNGEGITDGTFGDIDFKVGHNSPDSVKQEDVWNSIIGNDPEKPFLFPVSVSKGEEKLT